MYLRFVCMPVDSDKKRLNYLKHLKYFQVVSPIEKCSSSSKKLLLMGEVRKRKQQRRRKLNNTFPIVPPCVCACVCVHSPYLRKTRILCDIIYIYKKNDMCTSCIWYQHLVQLTPQPPGLGKIGLWWYSDQPCLCPHTPWLGMWRINTNAAEPQNKLFCWNEEIHSLGRSITLTNG